MTIQSTIRPQANWGVSLPVGGAQGVTPAAPAATVAAPVQAQAGQDWGNWSPKNSVYDHAYDAYQFSKFPLSIGGAKFWTGGSIRRAFASMVSKIPNDRLMTIQVREQFMRVPNMKADHARVLQMAYFNAASTNPAVGSTHPLAWLSQYGDNSSMADWLLRGPLILEMNMHGASVALEKGFMPDVPGQNTLKAYGQAAGQLVPPSNANVPTRP